MHGDQAFLEEDVALCIFIKAMQREIPEWELKGTYSTQYYDTMWPGQDGYGRYAFYKAD